MGESEYILLQETPAAQIREATRAGQKGSSGENTGRDRTMSNPRARNGGKRLTGVEQHGNSEPSEYIPSSQMEDQAALLYVERPADDDLTLNDEDDAYDNGQDPSSQARTFAPGTFRMPSTVRVVLLSSCAALGGFLGGYDTGIISGATLFIRKDFNLDNRQTEIIVSGVIGGAIAGGLGAGAMTDRWGRKNVILAASVVFVGGAIMMAAATSWLWLLAGRLVAGAAVGSGAAVPVYIAELAPPSIRGMLVNFNAFFIALGQLVSYLVAYALSGSTDESHPVLSEGKNWRWMLGLAAVPAIIQFLGMATMPKSPRFLVQQGKSREAMEVLALVRPRSTTYKQLEEEVENIKASLQHVVEQVPYRALITNPDYRKAMTIAIGLQVLQQFSGINTIMYYSATILRKAAFPSESSAILFSTLIALANCCGSLTAMKLIDKSGRRKLLLTTLVPVFVFLVAISVSFGLLPATEDGGESNDGDAGVGDVTFASWVALFSLVGYVFFYAIGLGCVPWIIISEIFPLEIRGKGAGIAIAANWTTNLLLSVTFLTLTEAISPAGTFLIFAGAVIVGWIFVYTTVPETKGISLEGMGQGADSAEIIFAAH